MARRAARKRVKRAGTAVARSSKRNSPKRSPPAKKQGRKILIGLLSVSALLLIAGFASDRSFYVPQDVKNHLKEIFFSSQCFAGMHLDKETTKFSFNSYEKISLEKKKDEFYVNSHGILGESEIEYFDAGYFAKYGYGEVSEMQNVKAYKIRGGRYSENPESFKGCILFVDADNTTILQFSLQQPEE